MTDPIRTIFSTQANAIQPPSLRQITQRVQQVSGINLGQGTCQLPVPPEVIDAATRAMNQGINRYTSPYGLPSLRKAIAKKLKHFNGIDADPETQILISSGTTGAFEGVCATTLNPGDKVVSFSPYYPYHHNTLKRFQAKVSYVDLKPPHWDISWEQLEKYLTSDVKFLLINTPGNPTGKVFTQEELERIGKLCKERGVLVVTDEIYEYMTYDGRKHVAPGSLIDLKENTITIGGYSKTFAITGWRIGFMAAPKQIMDKMAGLCDNIYVCAPAPLQQGVAEAIEMYGDDFYANLNTMYEKKRNFICSALAKLGLEVMVPQGAYYVMADFAKRFPGIDSKSFVDQMIDRTHVGAVPSNDFVVDARAHHWVRFCYALPDNDIEAACKALGQL
jgi:aminotransferase